MQPSPSSSADRAGIQIDRFVEIQRPAHEVYEFWRHSANLGSLLPTRASVTVTSDGRTHWSARGPMGQVFEWDAEITRDVPDREIAWESCPGADVRNSGVLRLNSDRADVAPTLVRLSLHYEAPGGLLGEYLAEATRGRAEREVESALAEAKRRLEAAA